MVGLLKRITDTFSGTRQELEETEPEADEEPEENGDKGETTLRFETAFGAMKRTEDKVKAVKEVSDGLVDESAKLRRALKKVENV